MDIISANNGTINGGLGSAFTVTLTGPTTMNFQNFDLGQEFEVILKQDSSGSNYAVTWPAGLTWQAGAAPDLNTNANGVDVFKFVCTSVVNNTYRDAGGAPSKLPAKLAVAALGLITAVNIATSAATTYHLSAGAGTGEQGRLPAVFDVRAGSGAGVGSGTLLARYADGSGSTKIGKFGGLAVGMNDPINDRIDKASNSGSWLPNGNLTTRGTITAAGTVTTRGNLTGATILGGGGNTTINRSVMTKSDLSGATIHINGVSSGGVLCPRGNGQIGHCTNAPSSAGVCACAP